MDKKLFLLTSFSFLSILSVKGFTAPPVIEAPQIFVDLSRVESMRNVRQCFHTAEKHPGNPVIRKENPWEIESSDPTASVIYDPQEKIFKCWYMGSTAGKVKEEKTEHRASVLCYAVSPDGIRWEKPSLGLHEIDGSTHNNIVIGPDYQEGMTHSESILLDPLEKDPARRYKALVWSSYDWNGPMSGIYSMTSPDGLHWTHTAEPIFRFRKKYVVNELGPVGDAQSLMIDTLQNRYVAALRSMPDRSFSFSQDFVTWTPPETAMKAMSDQKENTLYNHIGFVYGDSYLGFLTYFHRNADDPLRPKLDLRLLSSPDGLHFEMPGPDPRTRPALIPCGEIGDWDRFNVRLSGAPPIRVADKLYIYYRGRNPIHRIHGISGEENDYVNEDPYPLFGGVGLATLRVDGFASLAAGFDGGEITTETVLFENPVLRLNAKADFGKIFVEVLTKNRETIPGFTREDSIPMTCDSVDHPVAWNGKQNMKELAGQPVKFRFHLFNAHLYSYQVIKE